MKIDVIGPDKFKLFKITKDLSEDYLKIASDTQKAKLLEGIKFLNKEKPSLEKRAVKLQNKLEKFRLENKLINPVEEAKILTQRIEEIRAGFYLLNPRI